MKEKIKIFLQSNPPPLFLTFILTISLLLPLLITYLSYNQIYILFTTETPRIYLVTILIRVVIQFLVLIPGFWFTLSVVNTRNGVLKKIYIYLAFVFITPFIIMSPHFFLDFLLETHFDGIYILMVQKMILPTIFSLFWGVYFLTSTKFKDYIT